MRRLETVRFQAEGWQEPCESGDSRTVLRGTGGETPPVYPTPKFGEICDIFIYHRFPEVSFSAGYLNDKFSDIWFLARNMTDRSVASRVKSRVAQGIFTPRPSQNGT